MNTIKLGSKGEDVKLLQKLLGLKEDGDFGPNTDKKVKEWQKSKGLTPDGIVGPKSWSIILNNQNTQSTTIQVIPCTSQNNTGISDGMINFICQYETGKKFGYTMTSKDLNGYDLKDAGGHRTFGYGLLMHPNGKYMDTIKKAWTQKELEGLFLEHASSVSKKIDNWSIQNKIKLNQNQKDAIASACYNFGNGFLTLSGKVYTKTVSMIKKNPNDVAIRNSWSHMSDIQGKKYPGLIKRRQAEARWYFEGK